MRSQGCVRHICYFLRRSFKHILATIFIYCRFIPAAPNLLLQPQFSVHVFVHYSSCPYSKTPCVIRLTPRFFMPLVASPSPRRLLRSFCGESHTTTAAGKQAGFCSCIGLVSFAAAAAATAVVAIAKERSEAVGSLIVMVIEPKFSSARATRPLPVTLMFNGDSRSQQLVWLSSYATSPLCGAPH